MDMIIELKQQQKLSPQMIQAIEILQMGTQELQEYIQTVLLENPALELENDQADNEKVVLQRKLDWINATDRQNRWYHQDDAWDMTESVADLSGETLYDHLREQLDLTKMPARLALAVDCVLSGLNQSGYLEESVDELAARCGQPVDIVSQAESLVKELEPAGVAARTLSECLVLQLRRREERGLALTIAEQFLEDVARDHYHRIATITGAGRGDVQSACRLIRSLDPRPGAAYSPRETPGYLLPDLIVAEDETGFSIKSCDDFLPVLRVSSYYQKLMENTTEAEVRDYLIEKVQQAGLLVKNVEQRRTTLTRCAEIVVRRQEAFFRYGAGNLKGLSLSDVAEEMGVHPSTVSRAIRDKNLQCRQGVLPLSYFFSRVLAGEAVSAEGAKAALRTLLDKENKKKPLSDQKLCELLAAQGIDISRRTVAKYRDEMEIPSAHGRKQFFETD